VPRTGTSSADRYGGNNVPELPEQFATGPGTTAKPLIGELRREHPARPPVWFMRQAGRYLPEYLRLRRRMPDFLRFCYTPDLCVEAALQPLERFPLDAAILFSDILVVPDALGMDVRFVDGEGPVLTPIGDRADVDRLRPERLDEHLQPVFEAVRRLKRAIAPDVALIGFAGGPWTLAVYMIEGRGGGQCERARAFAYRQEALFARLIDVLVDATVHHLVSQIRAGAEVVQVFDSWAGGLPEVPFERWVIEPTRAIVQRLKADCPDVPVIGFPRAAGLRYRTYTAATGVDAVGIDAAVPLAWAAEQLQPLSVVQGNLDNVLLAAGGPAMEAESLRILSTLGTGPLIFNAGHGILPETDPDHVGRAVDLVRAWRR
jgi:uroporphyrinogen decarboxylase